MAAKIKANRDYSLDLPRSKINNMSEDLDLILADAEDTMRKGINTLEAELGKIRAGKASPALICRLSTSDSPHDRPRLLVGLRPLLHTPPPPLSLSP
ncbi:hypothetical protein, partial [Escherichia coli]|uniref:hypothetical protein n=1 Tax=Escherichia coli TaxID=562 RepID=UPI00197F9038